MPLQTEKNRTSSNNKILKTQVSKKNKSCGIQGIKPASHNKQCWPWAERKCLEFRLDNDMFHWGDASFHKRRTDLQVKADQEGRVFSLVELDCGVASRSRYEVELGKFHVGSNVDSAAASPTVQDVLGRVAI